MHLVDLNVGADKGIHLELHPRLTVVEAGSKTQERFVSLLGRAYVLAGSEVTSTIDGGGFLTPFDPTAVVALDLVGDGLDVIDASALPPPDPGPRDRARIAAAAELERRREEHEAQIVERDKVARLHDATVVALAAGAEERDGMAARLDDLSAAHVVLLDRLPGNERERVAAVDAAESATSRLEELRSVREAVGALLGPSEDGSNLRLGDDTDEITALVERAGALGGLRGEDLKRITGWFEALGAGTATVRSDARALASEIEGIETAWEQAAALGIEGDPTVARLAAERTQIGENFDLLVKLSESGMLGDTAKAQIDAAHVGVVRAAKSDEGAALAAEAVVLARYGFDSYLEYTIATSTRSVGQALETKVAELTSRVDLLDAELAAARSAAADHLNSLANEREPARERATAYLGYRPEGSSLDHLLRVPEVPAELTRLTVTLDEAIETAQGEVVRFRDTVAELDDERQSIGVRAAEIVEQQSAIESRIAELDVTLAQVTAEEATLSVRLARIATALSALDEAVGTLVAEVGRLSDASSDGYTRDDVARVVDALIARIEPSSLTHDPVLLRDVFAPFEADEAVDALEALVARSELCQIVYLTDDRGICDWARSIDPSVGRFVSVGRGRWSPRRLGRRVLGRHG